MILRTLHPNDYARWRPLWDGSNAFYGRSGDTALPEAITEALWSRFFDPAEPVHGLIYEENGAILGLTHYLFHRSTTQIHPVCYLQDLFTVPEARGRGIGKALIEAVKAAATHAQSPRLYCQTQADNSTARALYDKLATHHGFIVYTVGL